MTTIETGTRAGGRLIFGRINEDPAIEAAVLPAGGRLLVIASGGDVALRLAASGAQVTAVDTNPAQIAYVRDRLGGAPPRPGAVERGQELLRRALVLAGWTSSRLEPFCDLDDPAEQVRQWRERFDTRFSRLLMAAVLAPASGRGAGTGAYTDSANLRFDVLLRTRFERGLGRHPNRGNPFVRTRLLGAPPDPIPLVDPDRLTLVCSEVAEYLESVPPGSFDGISISNVLDATDAAYERRLTAAVRRAATDDALLVSRSFAASDDPEATEWATRDRSMLWGSIRAVRVDEIGEGRP